MNEATSSLSEQCHALRTGIGYCDLSGRSQIELTGTDRTKVLHGLCTNDIKRLQPGDGCEAFLTNVQGKITGFVNVFCTPDSLIIDTAAGLADKIIPALDRYVIREDVTFADHSTDVAILLVSGMQATAWLEERLSVAVPTGRMGIVFGDISGIEVQVRKQPYTLQECHFICTSRSGIGKLISLLDEAKAIRCGCEAVEVARIEQGTPIFGLDIAEENLPQEVARDELAISFTKGCYLGQETVARIDALGHVNRLLKGLKFNGETIPPSGTSIEVDGKKVARVTSSCRSQYLEAPIALAFVSRAQAKSGTTLDTEFGAAEVVALPFRKS